MLWLVFTGCTPQCDPLDAVTLQREDGVRDETVDIVQAAVDTFSEWIGPERICLTELWVDENAVSGTHSNAQGYYKPPERELHIGQESLTTGGEQRLTEVVYHELCHALDYQEQLSSIYEDALAATDPSDRREVFADSCMLGPSPLCREDPLDDILYGWVFVQWSPSTPSAHMLGPRREIVGLVPETDPSVMPVSGPGGVYFVWRKATTLWYTIVDPVTAEAVRTIEGPEIAKTWSVLGGDGDPLLVSIDGISSAWRLTEDGAVPALFPEGVAEIFGALAAGYGWVWVRTDPNGVQGFYRLDLDAGTLQPLPQGLVDGEVRDVYSGPAGIVAQGSAFAPVAVFDPRSELWSIFELPEGLQAGAAAPLADGLAVRWYYPYGQVLGKPQIPRAGFAAREDDWLLDEDACAQSAPGGLGTWLAYEGQLWWYDVDLIEPGNDLTFGLYPFER